VNTYDENKIGSRLSWIGDHYVYNYGTDQIIKFSKFDTLRDVGEAAWQNTAKLALFRSYFGPYLLQTELMHSHDDKHIALIQPKVSGHHLQLSDLARSKVREQCADLLARYESLKASNVFFDLIGREGLLHGGLGNILVTPTDDLTIFDILFLELSQYPLWVRPFLWLLIVCGRPIQGRRIKQFKNALASYAAVS
jgi:hypothetical protein